VLAPRLFSALSAGGSRLPQGEEIWGETRVLLEGVAAEQMLRDLLGGERVRPEAHAGRAALRVGEVLRSYPVAALVPDAE
jgi:hypothetical protein